MTASGCNLRARAKGACTWIFPAARLVCHTLCVPGESSQLAVHDADRGADPEGEPARAQPGFAIGIEIAERSYISAAARRDPAHAEADGDAQVVALGEAEHR